MRLEFSSDNSAVSFVENEYVQEMVSENGTEASEMLRAGIKAAQSGNRAEARHLLLRVTEADSKNEMAWLWLASISEYPEELLVFLNNVLDINPENERALEWAKATKSLLAKTFIQRGIDAHKENRKDFARQCFLQAIVHDNRSEMAWLWLASVAESGEEKVAHLNRVLEINPENENALASLKSAKKQMAQALLQKANAAVLSGDNEPAQLLLKEILDLSPELEEAWILKSLLTNSFAEKVRCFEHILELNPDSEVAKANLGSLRSMMKAEPEAEDFERESPAAFEPVDEAKENTPEEVAQFEDANFSSDSTTLELPFSDEDEMEIPTDESFSVSGETDENHLDTNFAGQSQFESSDTGETANLPSMEEEEEFSFEEVSHLLINTESEDQEFQSQTAENQTGYSSEELESAYWKSFNQGGEEEFVENEYDAGFSPEEDSSYTEEEESDRYEIDGDEVFARSEAAESDFPAVYEKDEEEFPEENFSEEAENLSEKTEENCQSSAETLVCRFCQKENEAQAFVCGGCRAILTLSDVEMLLAHQDADAELLQKAVGEMEVEELSRGLESDELVNLGIGHFNLKNFRKGMSFLQKAVKLNPNNVMLDSQVNSLAIRLAEIEEKENNHTPMPKDRTIMVVDDSPTVRKLISGKLEKCGHTVIMAVDGMDAMEKLNDVVPDLILLDITMPRMDGYQVCKLIRSNESTKEIPIVMISGKDGFFDKVRGRMAGTTSYITKPFGPETLMKMLETYLY